MRGRPSPEHRTPTCLKVANAEIAKARDLNVEHVDIRWRPDAGHCRLGGAPF
jgi:hypothetical protein